MGQSLDYIDDGVQSSRVDRALWATSIGNLRKSRSGDILVTEDSLVFVSVSPTLPARKIGNSSI